MSKITNPGKSLETMQKLLCLLLALAFPSGGREPVPDVAASFASYWEGKQYVFSITRAQLGRTPDWKETDLNPPLAMRRAMNAASEEMKLLFNDWPKWELLEIRLHHLRNRKWLYLVAYLPPMPTEGIKGHLPKFEVVILLDGTAVKPQVRPIPK